MRYAKGLFYRLFRIFIGLLSHIVTMGWLRSVESIKVQVSFAEYRLVNRALLQKRIVILSILLTKATPYVWQETTLRLCVTHCDFVSQETYKYAKRSIKETCEYFSSSPLCRVRPLPPSSLFFIYRYRGLWIAYGSIYVYIYIRVSVCIYICYIYRYVDTTQIRTCASMQTHLLTHLHTSPLGV